MGPDGSVPQRAVAEELRCTSQAQQQAEHLQTSQLPGPQGQVGLQLGSDSNAQPG